MKMYKTGGWRKVIIEVDVTRATDKSVWIMRNAIERRESRKSQYECYFDTWHEAYFYLVNRFKRQLDSAKSRLEAAKKELKEVLALTE